MSSLPDRLLDAADSLENLSRSQLQVLLRMAAVKLRERGEQIEKLLALLEERNAADLEDEPPAGSA